MTPPTGEKPPSAEVESTDTTDTTEATDTGTTGTDDKEGSS